jgi:AraC-like DNA-binding protein
MPAPIPFAPLGLLLHPYLEIRPLTGGKAQLWKEGRDPGALLLWRLQGGPRSQDIPVVTRRPGGLALTVILPYRDAMGPEGMLTRLLGEVRPQSILPHYEDPDPGELAQVLRRPPFNLGVECTEYIRWRGIGLDRESAQLIRRIIDLSAELRSVTALSRALYMSRRALGRKFMRQGLPVPSHWLHFGRLLRAAIRMQTSGENMLSVAYELGYPDGFSLSNQMQRLMGIRPSDARERLGWEWIMEAWLKREADSGGLAPEATVTVLEGSRPSGRGLADPPSLTRSGFPGSPDRPRRAAG